MRKSTLVHLPDIDFRSWEQRHTEAIPDFISWYNELQDFAEKYGYDERIAGQLTILSSVLWYLLPPKDYKKLTKHKAT